MDITVTLSQFPNGFSNHGQDMQFLNEGNCYDLPSKFFFFYSVYSDSLVLIYVANIIFMHIMRN